MEDLLMGFANIMAWNNLLAIAIGLCIGVIIGCLPGLSPSMAIALATPFTIGMPAITGIAFLLGVYKGGVYGGSISAILIATPGTPEAAATLLDGYPMVKQGKAKKALSASLYASISGDMVGTALLVCAAPVVASMALKIGPVEMVPLIVFAFAVIIISLEKNWTKGFLAACIGSLVAMIGVDPMEGSSRFVFNFFELNEGISLIPFLVGLFAIPEVIGGIMESQRRKKNNGNKEEITMDVSQSEGMTLREFCQHWKLTLKSAIIGGGIGAMPGLGSTAAAFTCYALAKRSSKKPEAFGNGSIEGVIACETGNNGTCGPALIPLLTLGIPGSSTAAVLYGSLMMHDIVPSPRIFIEHGPAVYALFISLVIGAILLYPVGLFFIKYASKLIYKVDRGVLFGGIFLLCLTGSYAVGNSMFAVITMLVAGLFSSILRQFHIPQGPILIAFILEPILERSFRQGLIMSGNDVFAFFTSPLASAFWICCLVILLYRPIKQMLK
ncbi:tripartite tricarboxylate transporter permease [Desulfocicer niacini]